MSIKEYKRLLTISEIIEKAKEWFGEDNLISLE